MNSTVICYIYKGDYLIFPENSAGLFKAGENVWPGGKQPRGAGRGWCVPGWAGGSWGREGSEQGSAL